MPQQRDTIKSILKMREGWRNKPYKDENGFMTVGWGHNISSNGLPQAIRENVKKYGYITLDEGNQLLETDIQNLIYFHLIDRTPSLILYSM